MNRQITKSETRSCGCSGTSASSKSAGGCGCGGSSCGSGSVSSACTSGTEESSGYHGVPTEACLAPRPRYFPGQLVTDADLSAAVTYHRSQQHLASSVIGGWGVYCGYPIRIDEESCKIEVGPGVAYDAKGRPLVSGRWMQFGRPDLSELNDPCEPCEEPPSTAGWYLGLVYDDCLDAAKPRYTTPCGPSEDPGCDHTRVQERARFVWIKKVPPKDHIFWVTGCLPDPCDDLPEAQSEIYDPCDVFEPLLDECTPDTGLRGAAGVAHYSRALRKLWNVDRNAQRILDKEPATVMAPNARQAVCCDNPVAAMIDVISGVACQPCRGQPIVLLAHVLFKTQGTQSGVAVRPIRRRVLSNADLTYLLAWVIRRQLCEPQTYETSPEPPQAWKVDCGDQCEPSRDKAEVIANIVTGATAPAKVRETATKEAAYALVVEGYQRVADVPIDRLLKISYAVNGRVPDTVEADAIEQRRAEALGTLERRPRVERALAMIAPEATEDLTARDKALAVIEEAFVAHDTTDFELVSWSDGKKLVERVYAALDRELSRDWLEVAGRYFKDFDVVESATREASRLQSFLKERGLEDEFDSFRPVEADERLETPELDEEESGRGE